jgi:TFIIF-interacting CTD phosphatase-like protein
LAELRAKMQQNGYNSENEKSSELLKLLPTDGEIDYRQLQDMKSILK